MTDLTLTVALPLLAAFVRPLFANGMARWIGLLLGPVVLALVTVILFAHWSTFSEPFAIALGGFAPPLGIAFYVDRLALLFALAVPLTSLLLWPHDTDGDDARRQSLTLLLAAALIGLALSGDLFNLYVFYELAAVASYGLIAGNRASASFVAGFRYLMISALGSVVGLLGIALINDPQLLFLDEPFEGIDAVSPGELAALVEEVVIPETWFFRDPPAFEYLADYACRHTGACCSSGWDVPVEPAVEEGAQAGAGAPGPGYLICRRLGWR